MEEGEAMLAVVHGAQLERRLEGHDFCNEKKVEVLTLRGEMWEWDT